MNKADAFSPAVPLAVGQGAGYAAVGAYVIGGLLVAGGAAVILDDPDASQKIKDHSLSIWNGFNETSKNAWITAINASVNAGASTMKLTDQMITDIQTISGQISEKLKNINSEKELSSYTGFTTGAFLSANSDYKWLNNPTKTPNDYNNIVWASIGGVTGQQVTLNVGYTYYETNTVNVQCITCANGVHTEKTYFNLSYSDWSTLRNTYDYNSLQKLLPALGIGGLSIGLKQTAVPDIPYFNDSINNAVDNIKTGAKEIALSIDNFIARNTAGDALTYDQTSGQVLNPDGTAYNGPIVYNPPTYRVPAIPTVDAPSIPIDDILVNDKPFVESPATPTDTSGILQGLWDWLKGILQSILDAIKAVAGAVVAGLTGLLENIIGAINAVKEIVSGLVVALIDALVAVFVPSDGYFVNFFKDIKTAYDAKIPIVGQIFAFLQAIKESTFGQNIPAFLVELPEKYGGGIYKIINFEYFTDYRSLILNFIRFTAWFIFIKRLWNRLPKVVY